MIQSPNTNKIYIGMTSKSINIRFSNHLRSARKHSKKYCSSREIIRRGGATIKEIARCEIKDHALRLEKLYITVFYGGICCNILKNTLGD
jgi:hypothetical protein